MKRRILFFYGLLGIGILLLLGRLFELQIIFGSQNRQIAEGNRIRRVIDLAPRGIIFDRHQQPLVRNVPIYRLASGDEKWEVISREEALKIEIKSGEQAEKLRVDMGREYLYGQSLAHLLGYLSEAGPEEVGSGDSQLGDLVGRTGLEEEYEEILRGTNGGEVFEVDSQGQKIREVGKVTSVAGEDIYLSVDAELSRVAFEALIEFGEGKPGAVVVTEAKTGQVLALVSFPSFNPNKITDKDLTDTKKPFFNRAISGVYPPGSTFKIVTAAAGVEEGKVSRDTLYEDKGFIQVGDYIYKNWLFSKRGMAEGKINVVYALKRSTDTFFYKVGEWVGANRLAVWAKAFGLGKKTGIDLPFESEGLVPSPEWKEKTTGERWFLGNTYHFAIGQADLLVTPLQINMMTSVIANDGKLCQPRVAKSTSGSSEVKDCQDLQLKNETLELIKEGLTQACSSGGTAWPLFGFQPQVACKTGTAEFAPSASSGQVRTHAWLTAYAPAPPAGGEIVVTAVVEAGGEGSDIAAPIVKKVLEHYFH